MLSIDVIYALPGKQQLISLTEPRSEMGGSAPPQLSSTHAATMTTSISTASPAFSSID